MMVVYGTNKNGNTVNMMDAKNHYKTVCSHKKCNETVLVNHRWPYSICEDHYWED